MATRLCNVVVDAAAPAAVGRFWARLLGLTAVVEDDGEVGVALGGGLDLVFVPVPEPKKVKNRVHLDLASASEGDQRAIVSRAEALGARRVDIGQRGVPWVVLADPEGNEFCVLEPRDEYLDLGPVAAIVVDALDPRASAVFWSHATGLPLARSHDEFASLRPETGPWLEFVRTTTPKSVKNRVHLDVAPGPGGDTRHEVARLESLGARRADVGQSAVRWTVLSDPESHEFCVLTPR
ncbi:VOC family protein [Actinosynnema sp. NPDC020468]|uniref:VOC family protein n=1 Tax=Actinosynnema sp. NPDC020468 TaxID=3154488 RepID=UPI0033FF255B